MPKNKTHSGAKKRLNIDLLGKVLRERAGKRHLLEHKPSTRDASPVGQRGDGSGRRQEDQEASRQVTSASPVTGEQDAETGT